MSQIEVPKIHGWATYGSDPDSIVVPKVHGWVLYIPGDDSGETPLRRSFCYAQRVRRS